MKKVAYAGLGFIRAHFNRSKPGIWIANAGRLPGGRNATLISTHVSKGLPFRVTGAWRHSHTRYEGGAMRRNLNRLLGLAPALGLVAMLAFPTTALAADVSIQVVSAQLVAKGAAVDVTVSFTCPIGDTVPNDAFLSGLSIYVQEAVSKTQQASGTTLTGGQICTGQPQSAVIRVLASVAGPPFRVGPALVNASIVAFDSTTFTYLSASSGAMTVRISK
jgi:hypothetical protein